MNNDDEKSSIYFGYYTRIILFSMSFILIFLVALLCFKKSIGYEGTERTSYNENGEVTYNVNLKDNDYFNDDTLVEEENEEMIYVSDLIENIDINFKYNLSFVNSFEGNLNYKIIGDLIIKSADDSKKFLDNKYILYTSDEVVTENYNNYELNQNIKLDYNHYDELAETFTDNFNVSTKAYLVIYLSVSKEVEDNIVDVIDGKSGLSITIPLNENELNIDKTYTTVNDKKALVYDGKVDVENNALLVFGVLLICLDLLLLSKLGELLIVLKPRKSRYDIVLETVLKQFDDDIVECQTLPDFETRNIIKVNNFKELMDAYVILNLPIMYVNVTSHVKCYFYILHDQDVYLYTMKAVDIENEE